MQLATFGFGVRPVVFASLSLGFAACGGGGGGGGTSSTSSHPTLTFAITDAASDEIQSFAVDVTSVRLHDSAHASDAEVATARARVDLADLRDRSQILCVTNFPAGSYDSMSVTIDFTHATCTLAGATTPATILDVDGAPLSGPKTVQIDFGRHPFDAPSNRHVLFELDVDLDQSLAVDVAANTVAVEPVFVLRVDTAATRPMMAAATLVRVDAATRRFLGELRSLDGTLLSTATFASDGQTIFHVDGVAAQGARGLDALARKPAGTWIQAYGAVDVASSRIRVAYVEAGRGTENGGQDFVDGHVVDRFDTAGGGAVLSVRGRGHAAATGEVQYDTTFLVATNRVTSVVRRASTQCFGLGILDIGQRVRVYGSMAGQDFDATGNDGIVRAVPTRVLGPALAIVSNGELTVDVARIGDLPDEAFHWTAAGASPPDPRLFCLDVADLGASLGIAVETPIAATGYLPGVDTPGADFYASSLENRERSSAVLFVRDRARGFEVGAIARAGEIELAIVGTPSDGEVAYVDRGRGEEPLPTSPAPSVVAAATGPRFYAIRDRQLDKTTLYATFANFSSELAFALGKGAELRQIGAVGRYDAAKNTLEARFATAVVE